LSVRAANTDTQIAIARRTVSPTAVLGDAPRLFARFMIMAFSSEIRFDDIQNATISSERGGFKVPLRPIDILFISIYHQPAIAKAWNCRINLASADPI
jgi:hypothetical protein